MPVLDERSDGRVRPFQRGLSYLRSPLDRIRAGAIILVAILGIAVLGYRLLGRTWLDSIYMVVITVSSVGYGETSSLNVYDKVFTIAVIVFGISAAVYTIGGFIQLIAEGEVQRVLGSQRMSRGIEKLNRHVIICGFGRIGQILCAELSRQGLPFVVIDSDPARFAEAGDRGHLALLGDASEEDTLLAAGVQRAKTVVTGLPNDAANVFITLTSRNLNSQLQIMARAEHRSTEKKLIQAGANRVIMPALIGAHRMARMITRPITADLMELVSDRSSLEVELDEITVPHKCRLVGLSVGEAEAHRRHRLLVVAIKPHSGKMIFNPGGDHTFQGGDTIIVMGRAEDIDRFQFEFGLAGQEPPTAAESVT